MKYEDLYEMEKAVESWEDDGGGPLCKEDMSSILRFVRDILDDMTTASSEDCAHEKHCTCVPLLSNKIKQMHKDISIISAVGASAIARLATAEKELGQLSRIISNQNKKE